MVDVNQVIISGNVGSIHIGQTSNGVSAFSMSVAIDQRNNETLWARANAYGSLAKKCQSNVEKGDYVIVIGELMERKKSDSENTTFLEIRIKEILFEGSICKRSKNKKEKNGE